MTNIEMLRNRFEAIRENYERYIADNFGPSAPAECPETVEGFKSIGLMYTELGNENQFPVQVLLNLADMRIEYSLDVAYINGTGENQFIEWSEIVDIDDVNEILGYCDCDYMLSDVYDRIPDIFL